MTYLEILTPPFHDGSRQVSKLGEDWLIKTLLFIGGLEESVNLAVKDNIIPWRTGLEDFLGFFFGAGGQDLFVGFIVSSSSFAEIGFSEFKTIPSFLGAVDKTLTGFSCSLVVSMEASFSDDKVESRARPDVFGIVELDEAVEVFMRVGLIRFFIGNEEVEDIVTEVVLQEVVEVLKVVSRTLRIGEEEVLRFQTEIVPRHFDTATV